MSLIIDIPSSLQDHYFQIAQESINRDSTPIKPASLLDTLTYLKNQTVAMSREVAAGLSWVVHHPREIGQAFLPVRRDENGQLRLNPRGLAADVILGAGLLAACQPQPESAVPLPAPDLDGPDGDGCVYFLSNHGQDGQVLGLTPRAFLDDGVANSSVELLTHGDALCAPEPGLHISSHQLITSADGQTALIPMVDNAGGQLFGIGSQTEDGVQAMYDIVKVVVNQENQEGVSLLQVTVNSDGGLSETGQQAGFAANADGTSTLTTPDGEQIHFQGNPLSLLIDGEPQADPSVPPTDADEAEPSPTPTMVPLESLDDWYTSEQQALADLTFEKVVNEAVISGDTKLQAYELNGTIFYKDADPNNPRLNLDYGRDAANVTVIVADPTLEAGYYILRVSEINDDLEAHNLPRSAVDFNVDSSGNFLGVDAQGKTLATRNTFQKTDGTQAAVFVPDGAALTYDENNVLTGYEFNEIRYSFNPDTGEFSAMAPHQLEAQMALEYSLANSSEIHQIPLPGLSFRASDELQRAIRNRLPSDELKEKGMNPLFVIVPDPEKLRSVIHSLEIDVEGSDKRVNLAGKNIAFTFISAGEQVPGIAFSHSWGLNNASYAGSAFELNDGSVHIIVRVGNALSLTYGYENYDEWQLLNNAFIEALAKLSGNEFNSTFQGQFAYEDPAYPALDKVWMLVPAVTQVDHDGTLSSYIRSGFLGDLSGQIPPDYGDLPGNGKLN